MIHLLLIVPELNPDVWRCVFRKQKKKKEMTFPQLAKLSITVWKVISLKEEMKGEDKHFLRLQIEWMHFVLFTAVKIDCTVLRII